MSNITRCHFCNEEIHNKVLAQNMCSKHLIASGIIFSTDYKLFCSQKCFKNHIQDEHSSIDIT